MSDDARAEWESRHRGATSQPAPEPFLLEMMPRLMRPSAGGLVLDVAAGRGRNSIALAQARFRVVAVDFSAEAMNALGTTARSARLAVWPVVANLVNFHIKPESFDVVVNINFLDRPLFGHLVRALRPGGALLAETFLIGQETLGHPRNPDFLLGHGELRALVAPLEIEEYREGMRTGADGIQAYRASVMARRL